MTVHDIVMKLCAEGARKFPGIRSDIITEYCAPKARENFPLLSYYFRPIQYNYVSAFCAPKARDFFGVLRCYFEQNYDNHRRVPGCPNCSKSWTGRSDSGVGYFSGLIVLDMRKRKPEAAGCQNRIMDPSFLRFSKDSGSSIKKIANYIA